jgi:hypothetical protein
MASHPHLPDLVLAHTTPRLIRCTENVHKSWTWLKPWTTGALIVPKDYGKPLTPLRGPAIKETGIESDELIGDRHKI